MTCVATTCPCPSCVAARVDTTGLGADEIRVLRRIADRLRMGAKQYGALDIKNDKRDWREEGAQEALDLAVYMSIKLTKERP